MLERKTHDNEQMKRDYPTVFTGGFTPDYISQLGVAFSVRLLLQRGADEAAIKEICNTIFEVTSDKVDKVLLKLKTSSKKKSLQKNKKR